LPKPHHKIIGNYEKWFLVPDLTVCGVGSSNIRRWLPEFEISKEPMTNWNSYDSFGLEAVSRVFTYSSENEGQREISEVLQALRGSLGEKYGTFITNQ